jgi:hypothetical protein
MLPVFIDSNFIEILTYKKIVTPDCSDFNKFMELFNTNQYLIRDSDYVTEVQSIKAMSLYHIQETYAVSNPLLCQILTAKLNILCDLKINHIIIDTVNLENSDLKANVFGLNNYNLIEDNIAFLNKISKIDYQPYLLDRDLLDKLHTSTHSHSHSSSSSNSSSESDSFNVCSDFASPSKKLKRL